MNETRWVTYVAAVAALLFLLLLARAFGLLGRGEEPATITAPPVAGTGTGTTR